MSHDQDDLSAAADISAPTAVDFDQAFSAAAASAGIRRVWELGKSMSQADPAAFAAGRARCVPHQAVNGRSWRSLTAVPDLPPGGRAVLFRLGRPAAPRGAGPAPCAGVAAS